MVIVLVVPIFVADQFRVLSIFVRLIVQVVDPKDTRVQDRKRGVCVEYVNIIIREVTWNGCMAMRGLSTQFPLEA